MFQELGAPTVKRKSGSENNKKLAATVKLNRKSVKNKNCKTKMR